MGFFANAQIEYQKTYCNPLNIGYGHTPIPNFADAILNYF
jgi:hypothetical protein